MKLRDHYDWIVLGDHPGALLSACLAAKLKLSVLVLPMGSTQGRLVSRTGQVIDSESNFILGLGQTESHEGLTRKCLAYLGATSQELSKIYSGNCFPQVITPQTRFTLSQSDHLVSEIHREFGKNQGKSLGLLDVLKQTESEFLEYWNDLPKRLTLDPEEKKPTRSHRSGASLSSLQKRLTQNVKVESSQNSWWISGNKRSSELGASIGRDDLKEIFSGLWYLITSNSSRDPELFSLLHLLSISKSGAAFKGGWTAFREFLNDLAARNGAHIPAKTDCRRIFIERGRFAGIQVTTRGNMISTTGGVLGCTLGRIYSRATYTGYRWFKIGKQSLVPSGWRFTLAVTIHKEAIPVGMMKRVVWQEKDAPPLEIETIDPADYDRETPDERIIYIRTVAPYTVESLTPGFQRLFAARMLRLAMQIMPFLEFHIVRIYPDFRFNETNDDQLSEIYGFSSLDLIPDNLLVYSDSGLGAQSGIDGLFLASQESYPEWGTLGGMISALEGVSWLAHQSGFTGPLNKV